MHEWEKKVGSGTERTSIRRSHYAKGKEFKGSSLVPPCIVLYIFCAFLSNSTAFLYC